MKRWFSGRVIGAALLVYVLAFGAVAQGFTVFHCAMGGETASRASCCCPAEPGGDCAPSEAAIGRASCCTVERVEVGRVPSEAPRLVPALLPVAMTNVRAPALAVRPPRRRPSIAAHPPHGPPLLLLKQSFLI